MKKNIPGTDFQIQISRQNSGFGIIHLVKEMYDKSDVLYFPGGNSLSARVALVTGGHKGIGFAIAKKLISEGARVIITGRDKIGLAKAKERLGAEMSAFQVWDILNQDEIPQQFSAAESLFGSISILVNNAGVTGDKRGRLGFESMDEQNIHYVHNVNLISTRLMCESFMKSTSTGTILNIISNTGILPATDAYQTSKWALYSYTKGLAKQVHNDGLGITVNGLCPGPVKTDMTFNKGTSLFRKEIPNRRIGLPEEIAELAYVQIINGLNSQNGMITVCDGGESL